VNTQKQEQKTPGGLLHVREEKAGKPRRRQTSMPKSKRKGEEGRGKIHQTKPPKKNGDKAKNLNKRTMKGGGGRNTVLGITVNHNEKL